MIKASQNEMRLPVFQLESTLNRVSRVHDDLPREVIRDDLSGGLGVKRPAGLSSQVDRELLKNLGTDDTTPVQPQLINERLRASVFPARRLVVRVHQDVGVNEVLIAHR